MSAAAHRALQEIAEQSGDPSWAAFAKAREDDANRIQKEAARIVADALTYGRRVEHDYGTFEGKFEDIHATGVTEFVIDFAGGGPCSGRASLLEYSGFLGIGKEKQTTTTYRIPGSLEPGGTVTTVTKNGIETVTRVTEWVPGSIDLKVGDSRPEQKPSSSAAGTRPSSFDPKKDGSGGVASGGTSPLAGILDAMVEQAERDGSPKAKAQAPTRASRTTGVRLMTGERLTMEVRLTTGNTGASADAGSGSTSNPMSPGGRRRQKKTGTRTPGTRGQTRTARRRRDGDRKAGRDGDLQDKNKDGGEDDAACPSGMTDEPSCKATASGLRCSCTCSAVKLNRSRKLPARRSTRQHTPAGAGTGSTEAHRMRRETGTRTNREHPRTSGTRSTRTRRSTGRHVGRPPHRRRARPGRAGRRRSDPRGQRRVRNARTRSATRRTRPAARSPARHRTRGIPATPNDAREPGNRGTNRLCRPPTEVNQLKPATCRN